MSADTYLDCPCCGTKKGVTIYHLYDFQLLSTGKIIHTAKGICEVCGLEFKSE